MKYSKIIVPLLVLILVAPIVRSQQEDQVDKVILASESNYPDALMSSKVSQKLGIPVLLTEKEEIND